MKMMGNMWIMCCILLVSLFICLFYPGHQEMDHTSCLFVLKCILHYLAFWRIILCLFQAAIGGDGKPDWDEIIDSKLAGTSNLDEIRQLADIAYWCLHKTPRRRPSISDVTHAISRIGRRQLKKDESLSISGTVNALGFLRRLEHQHVELSHLTSIKESPAAVAWFCFKISWGKNQDQYSIVFGWHTQVVPFWGGFWEGLLNLLPYCEFIPRELFSVIYQMICANVCFSLFFESGLECRIQKLLTVENLLEILNGPRK